MWFNRIRTLSLLLAFGAAAIPFMTYITDENRDLLWILIGTNIFACIMAALTTIRITLDVAGREKAKTFVPARWADNPVMSKWYTAVRLSWKWHVLAAVARMGLALALAQHLHIVEEQTYDFQGIFSPFFYGNHGFEGELAVRSQWITALTAIVVLSMFVTAETGLLSALTLLSSYRNNPPVKSYFRVLLARAALIICVASGMTAFYRIYYNSEMALFIRWGKYREAGLFVDFFKLAHRPVFALLDNGTAMAAEIARPIGRNNWFGCRHNSNSILYCENVNNFPHILMYLLLTGIALSFYAGITWLTLRTAMQLYQRAHPSPV